MISYIIRVHPDVKIYIYLLIHIGLLKKQNYLIVKNTNRSNLKVASQWSPSSA